MAEGNARLFDMVMEQGGLRSLGMRNSYSTYFLRRHFSVDAVALMEGLELNIDYDDGFVVWLNGVEVLRVNAPETLALNGFASRGMSRVVLKFFP
jgi:hypothetical protein